MSRCGDVCGHHGFGHQQELRNLLTNHALLPFCGLRRKLFWRTQPGYCDEVGLAIVSAHLLPWGM